MFQVFKYVDKFFNSLTNYLTFNDIFIIFVGLFLLSAIIVIVSTSNAYEAKLIKAIDKFNAYFIDNPQINEENLVAFNAKMKARFVPKQLRKSWQQFVLYRENKASTYMSFENCVSNPIKNSSYKRDTKLMNVFSHIFAVCALILNCFYCYETADLANILSSVLLTPVIILLLNYILQIFFNVKHSAIVSDLFQNYQYFEVNIDKATETLPEYVDYEVLFDRNEIKKGIPILYAYLQKRAEEEQRELERARLKNVEHEKFNFDDAGVEASLVLERAMQEAENYIAERKKYNQDTEQINSDITQEDMNYREITKEYNRQMQVSKETFANFKAQLEDVSSTIEANYLKKQQQQELDRQRNLERDFDTATERHKKVIESYHAELDAVDKFIAESRKSLEGAMKSEFSTYSSKVYDEAKKLVEEREKEKFNKLKNKINALEEELVSKNQELEKIYNQYQMISEQLASLNVQPIQTEPVIQPVEEVVQPTYEEPIDSPNYEDVDYQENDNNYEYTQDLADETESLTNESQSYDEPTFEDDIQQVDNEINEENVVPEQNITESEDNKIAVENYFDLPEEDLIIKEEFIEEPTYEEIKDSIKELELAESESVEDSEKISTKQSDDSIAKTKSVSKRGRPRKVVDTVKQGEKKTRGRPRKEVAEVKQEPKRKVGRPKKTEVKPTVEQKRGRGRPRKVETQKVETIKKKGPGRPKKQTEQVVETPKRKAGRPKKEATQTALVKKGRGRPKKQVEQPKKVGRPRKVEEQPVEEKRGRGRPKKVQTQVQEVKKVSKGRGRPRKDASAKDLNKIDNIDEYIKQIDNAIAEENAKLEETQKELAKNAKLRRKK